MYLPINDVIPIFLPRWLRFGCLLFSFSLSVCGISSSDDSFPSSAGAVSVSSAGDTIHRG